MDFSLHNAKAVVKTCDDKELETLRVVFSITIGSLTERIETLFFYFCLHNCQDLFFGWQRTHSPEWPRGVIATDRNAAVEVFSELINARHTNNDFNFEVLKFIRECFLLVCLQAGILSIEDLKNNSFELVRHTGNDRQSGKTE